MRGYKDLKQYRNSMARRSIPKKTNLNTEGEGASNIIFEMHKLAKQADTLQRERKRLTTQLKDNTENLKALKKRFESFKKELKTTPLPFLSDKNGKQKNTNEARHQGRNEKDVDSMNKFFEFDLEY